MITFFGASLTQQKSGYAVKLQKMLKTPVTIFGYGGMHISDAGICYIDEVLKFSPNYCFVDWFSTGYTEITEDLIIYLQTIIFKFSRVKCRLVFLFFPRLDNQGRTRFYQFIKDLLQRHGCYFIDLNNHFFDLTNLVRDVVHTTELGSQEYANLIYKKFTEDLSSIPILENIQGTHLADVKCITIKHKFNKYLELTGNCKIIAFELIIGRYSGLVAINNQLYNTWDIWCHYDRISCKLNNVIVDGNLRMEVLQNNFDTSSCRKAGINFSLITKKIVVERIFYVGDSLKFQEGE